MKKYGSLINFIVLVCIWSLFYGLYKYYVWLALADSVKPTLEIIAGYLSSGGILAYLIGGSLAKVFTKRAMIIISSLGVVLTMLIGHFYAFYNPISFGIITILVGFFYGLWVTGKNVIVSLEIHKTGLKDTFINALVTIGFLVFIIVGSFFGSFFFEKFSTNGLFIIIGIMIISGLLPLFFRYEKIDKKPLIDILQNKYVLFKKDLKKYIQESKKPAKDYYYLMISAGIFLGIATLISQKAIAYSVDSFGVKESSATLLLLFSAVGVIIGNLLSMEMQSTRRKFFKIFTLGFAGLVFVFPFLVINYLFIKLLAFFAGLFYGAASNLMEGYFFRRILEDDQKEYGSSLHGLFSNAMIAGIMFFINLIPLKYGLFPPFIIMGIMIVFVGFWVTKCVNLK